LRFEKRIERRSQLGIACADRASQEVNMSGITGVRTRSEEKSYCGTDNPESEVVCRAPKDEGDARTLICSSTAAEEPAPEPLPAPPETVSNELAPTYASAVRAPDYWTLSVGVGTVVGASAAATLDRHGHIYLGLSAGISLSPLVTASLVAGNMVDPPSPKEGDVRRFLEGDAVSASVGAIQGAGITNSAGGTAAEHGTYVPQATIAFEHNWEISSRGPRW
jgi:hypothetical protein